MISNKFDFFKLRMNLINNVWVYILPRTVRPKTSLIFLTCRSRCKCPFSLKNTRIITLQSLCYLFALQVFRANYDRFTKVLNLFRTPIQTRYIRLVVNTFHEWPTLRFELLSCWSCTDLLLGSNTTNTRLLLRKYNCNHAHHKDVKETDKLAVDCEGQSWHHLHFSRYCLCF